MRHKMMFSKDIVEVNDSSEESMSLSDEEVENLPGDKESQKSQEGEKKRKKNNAIQENFKGSEKKSKFNPKRQLRPNNIPSCLGIKYMTVTGLRTLPSAVITLNS